MRLRLRFFKMVAGWNKKKFHQEVITFRSHYHNIQHSAHKIPHYYRLVAHLTAHQEYCCCISNLGSPFIIRVSISPRSGNLITYWTRSALLIFIGLQSRVHPLLPNRLPLTGSW